MSTINREHVIKCAESFNSLVSDLLCLYEEKAVLAAISGSYIQVLSFVAVRGSDEVGLIKSMAKEIEDSAIEYTRIKKMEKI